MTNLPIALVGTKVTSSPPLLAEAATVNASAATMTEAGKGGTGSDFEGLGVQVIGSHPGIWFFFKKDSKYLNLGLTWIGSGSVTTTGPPTCGPLSWVVLVSQCWIGSD